MARRKRKYGNAGSTTNPTSGKDRGNRSSKTTEPNSNSSEKEAPSSGDDKIKEHLEKVRNGRGDSMDKGDTNARNANNDPEWYSKEPQMVIDAASIPFSEPLGGELDFTVPNEMFLVASDDNTKPGAVAAASPANFTVPGIFTAKTKSSFGTARDIRDPINVCANALYAHVRVVNSGRKNYDPCDLFLYCGSMADVYSYVMWMIRIYGKAFLASSRNRYVGKALLLSEHIDPDNVIQNLANFRYWINSFIAKVSSYAVPADIAYFQRRAWMYAHLYLENPDANIKDQLYQFSPDGFFRFELDSAGAGCLIYKTISEIVGHSNALSITDLESIGDYLLSNISGDEDFGLMSGDVIKAFNGNIIGLPTVPETVDIIPVYSEYVLLQIKNATVVPTSRGNNALQYDSLANGVNLLTGNIYQNEKGLLQSIEGCSFIAAAYPNVGISPQIKHVLTVNTPTPNPIDVMEITRLTVCGRGVINQPGANNVPVVKMATGADIVVEVTVTNFNSLGTVVNKTIPSVMWNNATWSSTLFAQFKDYVKFKYACLLYTYDSTGTGVSTDPFIINNVELISEVDNYTIVNWEQLTRIHEVAMLSLFWVPGVARMINF